MDMLCEGDGRAFLADPSKHSYYDCIIVDSSDPVGPAKVLFERYEGVSAPWWLFPYHIQNKCLSSHSNGRESQVVRCPDSCYHLYLNTNVIVIPLYPYSYISPFYEILHSALRPGGVVCTQAESLWLHLDLIKELHSVCSNVFKDKDGNGDVRYAYTTIPTYPSGQIGFMICQKKGVQESSQCNQSQEQKLGCSRRNAPPSLKYYSSAIHEAAFVLPKFAQDALTM